MPSIRVIGQRKEPKTPEEFYALGEQLDREAKVLAPFPRNRGFVFKARTWDDLKRFEDERARARCRQVPH